MESCSLPLKNRTNLFSWLVLQTVKIPKYEWIEGVTGKDTFYSALAGSNIQPDLFEPSSFKMFPLMERRECPRSSHPTLCKKGDQVYFPKSQTNPLCDFAMNMCVLVFVFESEKSQNNTSSLDIFVKNIPSSYSLWPRSFPL